MLEEKWSSILISSKWFQARRRHSQALNESEWSCLSLFSLNVTYQAICSSVWIEQNLCMRICMPTVLLLDFPQWMSWCAQPYTTFVNNTTLSSHWTLPVIYPLNCNFKLSTSQFQFLKQFSSILGRDNRSCKCFFWGLCVSWHVGTGWMGGQARRASVEGPASY